MNILKTKRLTLDEFELNDSDFILKLLNSETWLQHIGDRNVNTLEDAENYLKTGPIASYEEFGFGLWKLSLTNGQTSIGMCGILKRATLPHPDIGFAILPEYEGNGYALEAAQAAYSFGINQLKLDTIVAITDKHNVKSQALLGKLGLHHKENIIDHEHDLELIYFA